MVTFNFSIADDATDIILGLDDSTSLDHIPGTVTGTLELNDDELGQTATSIIVTAAPVGLGFDRIGENLIPGNFGFSGTFDVTGGVVTANNVLLSVDDSDSEVIDLAFNGILNTTTGVNALVNNGIEAAVGDDVGVTGNTDGASGTTFVPPVTNTPPVADDDSFATAFETLLSVPAATGVLDGDSDADGDPLTAVLATDPANGTLTLNSDGSFEYTPNAGFSGTDSFTYNANDGTDDSNLATVTITVADAPNTPPVADDDSFATAFETLLSVPAATGVLDGDTDADGDPLTAVLATGPANGTLTLNSDGSFDYTPNAGFSGEDNFTYNANDGTDDSNLATVTITVADMEDEPLRLIGTFRRDTLTGGENNDFISGRGGRDLLVGNGGNDTIRGGVGGDTIDGGEGNDTISGGVGRDTIDGGEGNDTISGGPGGDTIRGGEGNDTISGGVGRDTFVLAAGEGTDTITDFSNPDLIGLADGLTFADLSFGGNDISFGTETLATLAGVNTSTLTESNFVLI